ncbi:MAG: AI-2E family transporter [Chloroflexota bacterium]
MIDNSPDPEVARTRRERWWRYALVVLATVYVALLLIRLLAEILGGFAQIVLILFMAWLLAFVLSPVVTWLTERWGFSRAVAIALVYAATLFGSAFVLFYAFSSITDSMADLTQNYPETRERIEETLRGWEDAVASGSFELSFVELYRDGEAAATRIATSALGDVPQLTIAIFGSLLLVIILSLYMLSDSARIISKLKRVIPARYSDEVDIVERTISRAFGGFLRAQVILAGIQTVLTVAVIFVVGLPYGFLIGAASALAMLIPFFGPPLALIPPIVATAIFRPEWLIVVAPVLFVVQTVLVNYTQPRLMREALGMHPLLVLVGLVVGAQVAGVWGALFGIPVLAVANVFFNYVVNLRTIEETPHHDKEEVLDEVRREAPEATPEEVVAIAAERVEETEAAAATEETSSGHDRSAGEAPRP